MGYFITAKLPWVPFTLNDVNKKIELLKKRNIKLVGLSIHDSSGKTIEAFKKAFSLIVNSASLIMLSFWIICYINI